MARMPSGRPSPGEYADYAASDIAAVEGDDAIAVLESLAEQTLALLGLGLLGIALSRRRRMR